MNPSANQILSKLDKMVYKIVTEAARITKQSRDEGYLEEGLLPMVELVLQAFSFGASCLLSSTLVLNDTSITDYEPNDQTESNVSVIGEKCICLAAIEPYLETLDQMQRTILDMMTFCCQHAEPMDNFSKVLSGSPAVAAMSMIMQYCTNKLPFSSVLTGECLLNAYLSVTQHALNTLSSQLHTDIANHTKGMSISMDDGEDQAGILDGILMKVYYQFFKESYQFGVNLVNEVRRIRQQKGKETEYFIGKLINKDAHYFTKPIPTHSKRWKIEQILQADTTLLATPETPEYISRKAKDMRVFKRCWEELAEPFVLTTLLENLRFLEDYAYSQEMIRSQRNLSDLSYIIEYKLNPDQRQYLLVSFLIRRLLKAYGQN